MTALFFSTPFRMQVAHFDGSKSLNGIIPRIFSPSKLTAVCDLSIVVRTYPGQATLTTTPKSCAFNTQTL